MHVDHLNIIYRDSDVIALNKPAGLLCHPVGYYQGDSLLARLKWHFGDEVRLLHRLDQNTSGVILAALNPQVVPLLYKQFARRLIKKSYVALVHGQITPAEGDIELPLSGKKHTGSLIKIKVNVDEEGLPAHTHYRVLQHKNDVSLVEVVPHSGRKHQIRVHLAAIGHPVVGDNLYCYGGLPFLWKYYCYRRFPWCSKLTGHGLHAWNLEIVHPYSQRRLAFCATWPRDWQYYLVT